MTGAGSGIGRAIATRLAEDGFPVVVLDLDGQAADTVAGELSARGFEAVAAGGVDVVRPRPGGRGRRAGPYRGRAATVLVNNAGMPGFKEFMKITDEKWNRIMEVNLNGPFYFAQAVVRATWSPPAGAGSSTSPSSSAAVRSAVHGPLRHVQGRTHRVHQGPGPRARSFGDHRQHHPPRLHRHADAPTARNSGASSVGRSTRLAGLHAGAGAPAHPRTSPTPVPSWSRDGAGYVTGQVIGVNGGPQHLTGPRGRMRTRPRSVAATQPDTAGPV